MRGSYNISNKMKVTLVIIIAICTYPISAKELTSSDTHRQDDSIQPNHLSAASTSAVEETNTEDGETEVSRENARMDTYKPVSVDGHEMTAILELYDDEESLDQINEPRQAASSLISSQPQLASQTLLPLNTNNINHSPTADQGRSLNSYTGSSNVIPQQQQYSQPSQVSRIRDMTQITQAQQPQQSHGNTPQPPSPQQQQQVLMTTPPSVQSSGGTPSHQQYSNNQQQPSLPIVYTSQPASQQSSQAQQPQPTYVQQENPRLPQANVQHSSNNMQSQPNNQQQQQQQLSGPSSVPQYPQSQQVQQMTNGNGQQGGPTSVRQPQYAVLTLIQPPNNYQPLQPTPVERFPQGNSNTGPPSQQQQPQQHTPNTNANNNSPLPSYQLQQQQPQQQMPNSNVNNSPPPSYQMQQQQQIPNNNVNNSPPLNYQPQQQQQQMPNNNVINSPPPSYQLQQQQPIASNPLPMTQTFPLPPATFTYQQVFPAPPPVPQPQPAIMSQPPTQQPQVYAQPLSPPQTSNMQNDYKQSYAPQAPRTPPTQYSGNSQPQQQQSVGNEPQKQLQRPYEGTQDVRYPPPPPQRPLERPYVYRPPAPAPSDPENPAQNSNNNNNYNDNYNAVRGRDGGNQSPPSSMEVRDVYVPSAPPPVVEDYEQNTMDEDSLSKPIYMSYELKEDLSSRYRRPQEELQARERDPIPYRHNEETMPQRTRQYEQEPPLRTYTVDERPQEIPYRSGDYRYSEVESNPRDYIPRDRDEGNKWESQPVDDTPYVYHRSRGSPMDYNDNAPQERYRPSIPWRDSVEDEIPRERDPAERLMRPTHRLSNPTGYYDRESFPPMRNGNREPLPPMRNSDRDVPPHNPRYSTRTQEDRQRPPPPPPPPAAAVIYEDDRRPNSRPPSSAQIIDDTPRRAPPAAAIDYDRQTPKQLTFSLSHHIVSSPPINSNKRPSYSSDQPPPPPPPQAAPAPAKPNTLSSTVPREEYKRERPADYPETQVDSSVRSSRPSSPSRPYLISSPDALPPKRLTTYEDEYSQRYSVPPPPQLQRRNYFEDNPVRRNFDARMTPIRRRSYYQYAPRLNRRLWSSPYPKI